MRLIILEDSAVVADWAARFVLQRIVQFAPGPGRHFVLGLPTGGTPLGMYRRLIDFYREGRVSFKYVTTFNMDEYVGKWRMEPTVTGRFGTAYLKSQLSSSSIRTHRSFKRVICHISNVRGGTLPI